MVCHCFTITTPMNWGVLEGDCHRVPRPTRQQQGTQRTQQKTSHQQQTKSARWFFCSTENVINSFHLVVISTIHLWRYTFGCTTLEKLCFQGTGCGFDPGSCKVFWTLDDHVCSVVSVLHQGVAVLNYTVDKVSVTCEITSNCQWMEGERS